MDSTLERAQELVAEHAKRQKAEAEAQLARVVIGEHPGIFADSAEPPKERIHCTDLGNAQRLVARHGHDLRYCDRLGGWFVYDGTRWVLDTTGEVERRAKEAARSILREAANCLDGEERKTLAKWAIASESAQRLRAMIDLAKSEPGIAVTPEVFDRDPWLLNCLNGTLDLQTGKLQEHRREDLTTKLAPVNYDPLATLPLWDDFIGTVTEWDVDLAMFLKRAVGYSLSGSTQEEKLFFVHGPTATGKSTFIEAVKAAVGDYAQTADFETFLSRSQCGGPRNDIAGLAGSRFVASIEVDKGRRLAEGLVKQLTGGDTVHARFLYKEGFSFKPQFKLWLSANDAPRASDDDSALWRRILRVPFEHIIPEAERDPSVKARLTDPTIAGAAILAWAVDGFMSWLAYGLRVPERVKASTEEYRQEQDPLTEFLSERCTLGDGCYVGATQLWQAYQEWARENGEKWPVHRKDFAARIRAKGCLEVRDSKTDRKAWRGIGLLTGNSEPSEPSEPKIGKVELVSHSRESLPKQGSEGSDGSELTRTEQYYLDLAEKEEAKAEAKHAANLAEGWTEVDPDVPQKPGGEYKLDQEARRSYVRYKKSGPIEQAPEGGRI